MPTFYPASPASPEQRARDLFLATVACSIGSLTPDQQMLHEQSWTMTRVPGSSDPELVAEGAYLRLSRFVDPNDSPAFFVQNYVDASVRSGYNWPFFGVYREIRYSDLSDGLCSATKLVLNGQAEQNTAENPPEFIIQSLPLTLQALLIFIEAMRADPYQLRLPVFEGMKLPFVKKAIIEAQRYLITADEPPGRLQRAQNTLMALGRLPAIAKHYRDLSL